MNTPHQLTVFDFFHRNTQMNGPGCALYYNGETRSHLELFDDACRLTCGMAKLNLAAGTRVAVIAKNHPAFFHLLASASALNLCLVLINRRLGEDELAHALDDTTPQVVIYDNEIKDKIGPLIQDRTGIAHSFNLAEDFSTLYASDTQGAIGLADDSDPDLAYIIIHTAAVQGKPRGAVLSQANLILANLQLVHAYGLDNTKAYLNILPLFHIMGVNIGLATLMAGGKNVIMDQFSPQSSLDLIREQNVSMFGSFPPILGRILECIQCQDTPLDLSSLEIVAGLENPETAEQWEAATGSKFWIMYGQTETSGLITFSPIFEAPGSAGRVSPLVRMIVVDDLDNALPAGSVGEILVKGPLVFKGYWNADELNSFTFRNGWHHTGDMGQLDENGYLYFKGRKPEKELIKPGGENVFPAEVEKALVSHEAVDKACVFGVPDAEFGEAIKAVCSLNVGCTVEEKELIAYTGNLIAGFKKPKSIVFVDPLPLTAAGDIDRFAIKEKYTHGQ
ncbi:long-chain fatty acid--CoA ligase [Desulfobacter hydrogenophilus]|uniref:Long-chain fatty acid--CoA ligase n=1 Tax=Desulfobacter hydrogenophilus TaxID=2291 RepID=A0A328FE82_9BACT|nr:AMP-binding protein [Desulfobacter hydrogenophilus]NDY71004.1 AMP-binding protein [Desulfobacter hydrogenophilus]QBH12757.1 long-chain fatty acid--CoA ligase [Desulfobacter hydrogenophilus]RAM02994.1 long-chain fatty acid--CoA ligase [Desulfobacter hydrogenophilus]